VSEKSALVEQLQSISRPT